MGDTAFKLSGLKGGIKRILFTALLDLLGNINLAGFEKEYIQVDVLLHVIVPCTNFLMKCFLCSYYFYFRLNMLWISEKYTYFEDVFILS